MTPDAPTNSHADDPVRHLLRQMIRPHNGTLSPLPRSLMASCMLSHDIHLMGAVNSILELPDYVGRIQPALEFRHILAFKMRYCERCMTDNPKSEWADGRYVAGWDFGRWFLLHYNKNKFQPSDLMAVRQWLTQFFHKSPAEVRACLTRTVLAEVLREKTIRILFSDWENLPELKQALSLALAQKSRFL